MREVARVELSAVNEKRYVTSLGVTSSWDPEETEVSDDSPTLVQPTITCKKAQTFVPVSIEFIPHLLGANRRPSGQRGFYQHWRVGGDVLVGDAFRLSNFNT